MTETAQTRRVLGGLAVLAALFAVAACGPATDTAQPPVTTQPPAPTMAPAQTPSQAAGGPSSQPAPPPGIARCGLDRLKVTVGTEDAGLGHRGVPLIFTNTSAAPCRLYGYPGVAGLDAHDNQVAQARRTLSGYLGGSTIGLTNVDIASGGSASALLETSASNPDGSSCTAFAGLLVTPPDETHSVKVPFGGDGCGDPQIHPVVPGITGSK